MMDETCDESGPRSWHRGGLRSPSRKARTMETAQPNHTDNSPESYIEVARQYQQIMHDARGTYEQTAADYRNTIRRALDAGVPAQALADALDVTRDAVYKAARSG